MIRKWIISALFLIQFSSVLSQGVQVIHEIDAPISCVWDKLFNIGNWSEWNDVFDIQIDGLPQVGSLIEIRAKFLIGPPSFTKERISVVEDTDTLKKMCWDMEELGVPNIRGTEALFWIPTPPHFFNTERCIVLTESQTTNGTMIDNYINLDSLGGVVVFVVLGILLNKAFQDFNEALNDEVINAGCGISL